MSVVRIKIESDSVSELVVFPTWSGSIEQSREDDSVFYRSKLTGDFRFTGAEYNVIKGVPDCELIEIFMEELCGSTWSEKWRGYFTTYDAQFNDTNCVAVVRPELKDRYKCFFDQIDTEYVFSAVDANVVKSIQGAYKAGANCCTDIIDDSDPTPTDPVCAVPANYCFDKNTRYDQPLSPFSIITSCFHRIQAVGTVTDPPPFGTGWTHIALGLWWRCPLPGEVVLGNLRYGRMLTETLDYLALQAGCDFSVRSHFFGLRNTHPAAPVNDAYAYATEYLQTLTIHQKSDVKCPDCSNEAESFVWKITWKKLLDDLRMMFNVYWKITPENDFILEHISYFEAVEGLDLTAKNIELEYGKGETSAPNIEKFFWADNAAFSPEHAGLPISYGDCGNGTKEHRVNLFSNDIFYIRQVENQAEIADTGYCLVCTLEIDDVLYVRDNNNPLGWEMLHENLHKHNRYFTEGEMNGVAATFETVRRSRKLKPFNTQVDCADDFTPEDFITTPGGEATVSRVITNYNSAKDKQILTIEALI